MEQAGRESGKHRPHGDAQRGFQAELVASARWIGMSAMARNVDLSLSLSHEEHRDKEDSEVCVAENVATFLSCFLFLLFENGKEVAGRDPTFPP
jgi:hypothetical protein